MSFFCTQINFFFFFQAQEQLPATAAGAEHARIRATHWYEINDADTEGHIWNVGHISEKMVQMEAAGVAQSQALDPRTPMMQFTTAFFFTV